MHWSWNFDTALPEASVVAVCQCSRDYGGNPSGVLWSRRFDLHYQATAQGGEGCLHVVNMRAVIEV